MPVSAEERRRSILDRLRIGRAPITGTDLAHQLNVTRQVIVQDVALLRAAGHDVIATPRGYLLSDRLAPQPTTAVLACQHDREHTEDELQTLVDLSVQVVDVIVEHPLYGEMRGMLMLQSRQDVRHFIESLEASSAPLLSSLTHGVHLHTVATTRPEVIQQAREALHAKGYLVGTEDATDSVAPAT